MAQNLTQKERLLLEDQKKHEELCIQKYTNYAAQVQDPQLKQLLNQYAQQEQQHLDTINQLLAGQTPSLPQGGQQEQKQPPTQTMQASAPQSGPTNQRDAALLNDLLMTEKYISGTYNTAIFEFTCPNQRQLLNHIQTEEQEHGEGLYSYMNAHGMYNPQ